MMDRPDLLHQLPAIILAGVCICVWLIARNRRKAVDRLVRELKIITGKLPQGIALDGPGRVIARSVRRMKRRNHERC